VAHGQEPHELPAKTTATPGATTTNTSDTTTITETTTTAVDKCNKRQVKIHVHCSCHKFAFAEVKTQHFSTSNQQAGNVNGN